MLELLDTTLRDGAQNTGISYSQIDKQETIKALSLLGIKYIEAGSPGYNIKDNELLSRNLDINGTQVVAFGSTRKKNVSAEKDVHFMALINCAQKTVAIFGKASAHHATNVLGVTLDENIKMVAESVALATKCGKEVIFDAEHFFQGYKDNPTYAVSVLQAAHNAGAKVLALCDTNGGSFPNEVTSIVRRIKSIFSTVKLGIHCHNDNGLAVANTLSAISCGVTHIQGTLLGIGERCGNCNLSTLLPILALEKEYSISPPPNIEKLTMVARTVAEIANIHIPDNMPYIGEAAFSHKAGMHADGMLKSTDSFEHINPELVGNSRKFVLSEASGKHLILNKLLPYFPYLTKDDKRLEQIAMLIKSMENNGYTFENAEGSFILFANKILEPAADNFTVVEYNLSNSSINNLCDTTITIAVGKALNTVTSSGVGPVHALDIAMRECLIKFYPSLRATSLIDYKVRVINPKDATSAIVRVTITTTDGNNIWRTVGVDANIIKASFIALTDSYNFALFNKK